jgi:hypothetical protein
MIPLRDTGSLSQQQKFVQQSCSYMTLPLD